MSNKKFTDDLTLKIRDLATQIDRLRSLSKDRIALAEINVKIDKISADIESEIEVLQQVLAESEDQTKKAEDDLKENKEYIEETEQRLNQLENSDFIDLLETDNLREETILTDFAAIFADKEYPRLEALLKIYPII